jgi:hypothetical protein
MLAAQTLKTLYFAERAVAGPPGGDSLSPWPNPAVAGPPGGDFLRM